MQREQQTSIMVSIYVYFLTCDIRWSTSRSLSSICGLIWEKTELVSLPLGLCLWTYGYVILCAVHVTASSKGFILSRPLVLSPSLKTIFLL